MFSKVEIASGATVACQVEYAGSEFCGWQSQTRLPVATVQETLESALASIAAAPVKVVCAGRTDTGVHATSQVVSFRTPVPRSQKSWVFGANAHLPPTVRVKQIAAVNDSFHARFSALSRRYQYVIANTPIRPALQVKRQAWYRPRLDHQLMHQAAQSLIGEQDFSAFRAASCQSHTAMRRVDKVRVFRLADTVVIDIEANAFLHHMVRNIAGSLIAVGSGAQRTGWIDELLTGRDRRLAADTAPPDGLYFVGASYPADYDLPWPAFSPFIDPEGAAAEG